MTYPDREAVIDVLVMSPMTDGMGTSMVPIRRTADEILTLFAPALQRARADAWDEAYEQGVIDERTSEDNIGIAGLGGKIAPARRNPYRQEVTE